MDQTSKPFKVACFPALQVPDFYLPELEAIRAWAGGRADEAQQTLSFLAVVEKLCMVGGMSFHPGDPLSAAMKEGRRFCGVNLLNFQRWDAKKLRERYVRGNQDG